FTSFGCPSARQSLPKLRAFRNQFEGKGVALWLVNSCTQEDPSDNMIEMLVRSRGKGLGPEPALGDPEAMRLEVLKSAVGNLPVLRDEIQLVAQRLGVATTGEAVASDPKTSTI